MDQQTALHILARRAAAAPSATPAILSDVALNECIDLYISGKREVLDLVEMRVDDAAVEELSTAASVGTGVSQGLGRHHPTEEEQLKKILSSLEGYRRREGLTEMRPSHIRQFAEELGLSERLGEKLLEYLRRRGDV